MQHAVLAAVRKIDAVLLCVVNAASSTPRLPQGAIKVETHGTTLTKAALEAQTSAQRM